MEGGLLLTRKSQSGWSSCQIDPGELRSKGDALQPRESAAVGKCLVIEEYDVVDIVCREEVVVEQKKQCCRHPMRFVFTLADNGDLAPRMTAGCIEEQPGPSKLGVRPRQARL